MHNREFQRKDARTQGRQEGEKEMRGSPLFFTASVRPCDFALIIWGIQPAVRLPEFRNGKVLTPG